MSGGLTPCRQLRPSSRQEHVNTSNIQTFKNQPFENIQTLKKTQPFKNSQSFKNNQTDRVGEWRCMDVGLCGILGFLFSNKALRGEE